MTGKAYAFVEGIGPDADTGATLVQNNQGDLATFDTPAEVDAKIAAAIAAEVIARNAAIASALVPYSTTAQMNAAIAAAIAGAVDPRSIFFMQQDFAAPNSSSFLDDSLLGGASAAATATGAGGGLIVGHPGLIQITSGVNPAGVGAVFFLETLGASSVGPAIGGGEIRFFYLFKLDQLATVAQDFNFIVGAGNNRSAPNPGMWIDYSRATSPNWRGRTTGNTVTSTIAVTAGWHRAEIVVNAGGTSVEYFMDGVSLGTLAAGIPVGAGYLPGEISITKTAGVTPVTALIDYASVKQTFTALRAP